MTKQICQRILLSCFGVVQADKRTFVDLVSDQDVQVVATMIAEIEPERSMEVMRMRYGFSDQPMSYDAIGLHFKLSRERVRQIIMQELLQMSRDNHFYPLAIRAQQAGISSGIIDRLVRDGVDPEFVKAAQTQALGLVGKINEGLRFLLECEDRCTHYEPCATCCAKSLLKEHNVWDEIKKYSLRFYGQHKTVHDLPVSVLKLSVRPSNALKNDNIKTLGQLVRKTYSELIRTPNMGRKSMVEIEERLIMFGLSLKSK